MFELYPPPFDKAPKQHRTGNFLSKKQLEDFIAVLEGRSYKQSVGAFYLAVGEGMATLLSPTSACNPFSPYGCRCKGRGIVHVMAQFAEKPQLAKVPSPTRALPPPPSEEPPPAPSALVASAQNLAAARTQLREEVAVARG